MVVMVLLHALMSHRLMRPIKSYACKILRTSMDVVLKSASASPLLAAAADRLPQCSTPKPNVQLLLLAGCLLAGLAGSCGPLAGLHFVRFRLLLLAAVCSHRLPYPGESGMLPHVSHHDSVFLRTAGQFSLHFRCIQCVLAHLRVFCAGGADGCIANMHDMCRCMLLPEALYASFCACTARSNSSSKL